MLQVKLHSSDLAEQSASDAAVRDQLGPALDQTAGMDDPDTPLLLTLQWSHDTFSPNAATESCWMRATRERKDAFMTSSAFDKRKQEALEDANRTQRDIEVAHSSLTGLPVS